ncbi:MAG: hypothetical protein AAFW95_04040 [Cyanobacteria bacterium J06638_6]
MLSPNPRLGLLLLLAIALANCTRPGEGVEAARGFARVGPVIEALDAYNQEHDHYPASLSDLTPAFLSQDQLTQAQHRDGPALRYHQYEDKYELYLRHGGRLGRAECKLVSGGEGWAC